MGALTVQKSQIGLITVIFGVSIAWTLIETSRANDCLEDGVKELDEFVPV